MVKRKSLSSLLLDSVTPKLYSLIQLGFKNEKDLYNTTRLVEQFSRKILNHDIPSLKMTASRHGLVALSSPLIGLKYSILVYHKQMIENQWEDYKSSISDYDVMINPIITRYTEEKETKEEECTVLPLIYFTVERPTAIEVEFKDINEINRCEMFYGFEARVLHHEIDHLQGTVPSNLKVCKGKIRQKYNLEHSDKVDNYYDALCKDEMAKLERVLGC